MIKLICFLIVFVFLLIGCTPQYTSTNLTIEPSSVQTVTSTVIFTKEITIFSTSTVIFTEEKPDIKTTQTKINQETKNMDIPAIINFDVHNISYSRVYTHDTQRPNCTITISDGRTLLDITGVTTFFNGENIHVDLGVLDANHLYVPIIVVSLAAKCRHILGRVEVTLIGHFKNGGNFSGTEYLIFEE